MSGVRESPDPALIRKHILLAAERMVSIARGGGALGEDGSAYLRALEDKMTDGKLQALDEEVADLITKLWSFEGCRRMSLRQGRPEAYDKM
jgi:hypothetical protein